MLGVPAPRFFAEGSPSLGVIEGENWLMLLMAVTVEVRDVGNTPRSDRGSVDIGILRFGQLRRPHVPTEGVTRRLTTRQSAASSGEYAHEEAPSR